MTRKPDPLHNLADALSEDIVATQADALMHEAAGEPGGERLVASFDRIAARAAAQSRRRRLVERLRALFVGSSGTFAWRPAMAGVAGIFVMVIAGGLYFHQPDVQFASAPSRDVAGLVAARSAPPRDEGPMSLAEERRGRADRLIKSDQAAAELPAPAAAPPVVAAAPPPAPPAAAGVADEASRLRTADVRPDAPAPAPASRAARKVAPAQQQAEDRIAALAERHARFNAASVSPQPSPAASAYAPTTSGPAAIGGLGGPPQSFVWPVRGRVIAGFGLPVGGAPNQGIDLAVPAGTDVHAAEDGVVIYAGNEIKNLGNLLLVRHRDGLLTAYGHAQSFAVKPGDSVRRGQVIAKSGQSGEVSAPQLHFEIRRGITPVDPAQYLPPPG